MEENCIGQRIAKLRKEANLTQNELANSLNVSNKTVSKWETGKGDPSIEFLEPLAKILGCSLDDILTKGNEIIAEKNNIINNYENHNEDKYYLSAAGLQRKYKIGYSKAANLIDELEKDGYIKFVKTDDVYLKQEIKSKNEIINYIEAKLKEDFMNNFNN